MLCMLPRGEVALLTVSGLETVHEARDAYTPYHPSRELTLRAFAIWCAGSRGELVFRAQCKRGGVCVSSCGGKQTYGTQLEFW